MDKYSPGQIIKYLDKEYAIVSIFQGNFLLIERNIKHISCKLVTFEQFEQDAKNVVMVDDKQNPRYVNIAKLNENVKTNYKKYLAAIELIRKYYGPNYTFLSNVRHDSMIGLIEEKSGLKKTTFWKVIRVYFQSGMDDFSLLDKRTYSLKENIYYRNGRHAKTGLVLRNEDIKNFNEAIAEFKRSRYNTIKNCYISMLNKHYRQNVMDSNGNPVSKFVDKYPTEKQFRNYFGKKVSRAEYDSIKLTPLKFRNDRRLLLSDTQINVQGPYDIVEMDECEIDISLVDKDNPNVTVGRPIAYIMIDVYTRLIVAYSLSFENNSIKGLTNCLLSLSDNKIDLCNKYNIEIKEEEWPHNYIPHIVRADYGSEYTSYEIDRIFNELNIQKQMVPPSTGSLKGVVEEIFHEVQTSQKPLLENKGLITKDHDSKHHDLALLNIDEYEHMLVIHIVEHNKKYMKDYKLSKQMIDDGVRRYPAELFRYGIAKYGTPKKILNLRNYKYSLLNEVTATISRSGITYKKLIYFDYDNQWLINQMYACGLKTKKIKVRLDRLVDQVYILQAGNQICAVPLSKKKFSNIGFNGLTWSEYDKIIKESKKEEEKGLLNNLYNACDAQLIKQDIVDKALEKAPVTLPTKKNMKVNRQLATETYRKQNTIMDNEAIRHYIEHEYDDE